MKRKSPFHPPFTKGERGGFVFSEACSLRRSRLFCRDPLGEQGKLRVDPQHDEHVERILDLEETVGRRSAHGLHEFLVIFIFQLQGGLVILEDLFGDLPMGVLFDPSDPDDFVRKAILLFDDAMLRRKLGAAGAAYSRRMPGPCDEARGLIAVYEAAMGRTRWERVAGRG